MWRAGEASAAAVQVQELQAELEQQQALVQRLEEDLLLAQQGLPASGTSLSEPQTDGM